jgi:lactoylglutathione lyase
MIKFLHTRIKIGDMARSVVFYEKLGFVVHGEVRTSPQGNEILFMEIPGNDHLLELTYTKDFTPQVPEDLVHTALGVPDLMETCGQLEEKGIVIWPEGWRDKFITGKKMAFVTDPDGYEVEILENK